MHRNRIRSGSIVALALALAAVTPATTLGGTDDFTLINAIPADAFFAAHARGHEGQAFLNEQYARVWKAVENAHFDRDIRRFFKQLSAQAGNDPQEFDEQWQRMMGLLAGVEWSTLWKHELAFAEKLGLPSMFEAVVLMKPPAEKIANDFEGLSAFLKALAELAPQELVLTEDDEGDTAIRKLTFSGAPVPMGLTLARHKDTLLIGLGSTMVEQSLAMLRGEAGTTLASTPRFQEAFKRLPAPTDGMTFVDMAKFQQQLRSLLSAVEQMTMPPPAPAEEDESASTAANESGGPRAAFQAADAPPAAQPNPIELIRKVLSAVDLWDYIAEVATTDGMKTTKQAVTVLRADAKSKPLYQAFYGTGTLSEPLKYVPQEASDVSVSTGIDFLVLYQEVLSFIGNEIPGGADQLADWSATQEQQGLDVETDVLGWLKGGYCTFSVPGATPYSPSETVLMLEVRDEEKAREMIGRLLEAIEPMLAQQGGAISDAEVVGAEGFRSVVFPMLAMFGLKSPTVGVADGRLFAGSSPEVITAALDVASGEAESFAHNELFIQDGIPPGKNVTALKFSNLTKWGEDVGNALKIMPMMIRLMGGSQVAQNPWADTGLRILAKVGKVAPEFNFLQSSCSQSTFDGQVVVTKSITTYREPPAPPAPPTEEDEPETPPPGEPEG